MRCCLRHRDQRAGSRCFVSSTSPPATRRGRSATMTTPMWTITILTIPGREEHLKRLLHSLSQHASSRTVVHLVYNRAIRDDLHQLERQLKSWAPGQRVEV